MSDSYIANLGYQVDTSPLKKGEMALDKMTVAGDKTEAGIGRIRTSVGLLSAGIAALAANTVITDVINYSDSWARVDNQLRLVIDSEEQLVTKRAELIELSKETNANLSSTVALYAELYRNTRELGTSEEQVATVTRTLNNLFVSGGKDAQTQAGAIRQLSQALGAGALRGDEFNSVAEAAPRILDAISISTGLAKGELRDFAATGGITAEILIDAVSGYASEAQRLADVTTKTFEQSTENAKTNVLAYVGAAQSIQEATLSLGESIEYASENIDAIVNGVQAAGAVMLVSAVPATIKYTAATYASVQAQLLANTQAVRTVSALGSVTIATGTATVATNALTLATRVLLSPFGLLLAAVSAAGIAYSLTDDKASEYNDTLDIQKGLLDDVTAKVKLLSDFQKADVALDAQFKLNDNKQKQRELEAQILADSFNSSAIASLTLKKQEQLNDLKAEEARLTSVITAANEKTETPKKKNTKITEFDDSIFDTDSVDLFMLKQSKAYDAWISGIEEAMNQTQMLETEMGDVWEAMLGGDLDWDAGIKKIAELQDEIDSLEPPKDIGFDIIANGATDSLRAMQSLSAQGSDEYRKLGVAIEAVNAIQAISAVLNQASGDPYTAFARMAAMAASVASLGYSVGSISGGGFDDVAAERQETQGVNEWGDKSESISNSIDITANAVEKLVGINTDMLKALTSVQDGIAAASVLIGRDVTTPSINQDSLTFGYDDVIGIFEPLGIEKFVMDPLGIFGSVVDKLFGGSSKVVDEGIMILGGALGDLIEDVTIQSFQEVQYKKWSLGSKKSKTATNDITDEVGSQFQLVLDSIADSVYAGATTLGLAGEEVEKAIQDFEIETIKISLKGLSTEEQQAEIEAVFGKIFDDLASDVIPFLDDFQLAGEGLGETLTRVATQVSIMDVLVEQLGVNMFDKLTDPEMYTTAANNLSILTGGVEEFASKTSDFINNFASDETKLDIYQTSLEKAFSEVGLTLPDTADGMWDLMNGLSASTEAGQAQIAMLLNMQDQSSAYYDLLENSNDALEEAAQKIADTAEGYRDAIESMYDITEELATANLDAALRAARMGDFSLAEDLNLNSVAPDSSNYSSKLEYELARADTAAKLEELAKLTEGTVTVDEKQLETLEQIRDEIKGTSTASNTEELSNLKAQMVQLNEIQARQNRVTVDSNSLLQQMVSDGIPVRVEN